MIIIKKEIQEGLNEEIKKTVSEVAAFFKDMPMTILISKEIVGRGQLGVDIQGYVLIATYGTMIIKKEVAEEVEGIVKVLVSLKQDYMYI